MSSSEAATAFPSAAQTGGEAAAGTNALAQGLLLVRASALNLVRLQLAMERRDRPVALSTIDELMALDRRLGDFVGELPGAGDEAGALEEQRRALMGERFTLAAGARGPAINPDAVRWIEPAPLVPTTAAQDALPEPEAPAGRRLSARLIVALAMLGLLAAALAAFLFFTETGRALIGAAGA